jgi:hypothetical protein
MSRFFRFSQKIFVSESLVNPFGIRNYLKTAFPYKLAKPFKHFCNIVTK